jgi:hypothetical protein
MSVSEGGTRSGPSGCTRIAEALKQGQAVTLRYNISIENRLLPIDKQDVMVYNGRTGGNKCMSIDIEKAKQLRLEGMTLQQVADALNCSLAWCKANLKGVKQPNKDKAMIDEIRKLGRSKQGVTTGEIRNLVLKQYDLKGKPLQAKVAEMKRVARRDNKDVLIRPYWMIPEIARDCTTTMLQYANEVWEFKEHLANKYRQAYNLDSSYTNAIIYGLTAMAAGENSMLLPQGLLEYGYQLEVLQDSLDGRNTDIVAGCLVGLEDVPMMNDEPTGEEVPY